MLKGLLAKVKSKGTKPRVSLTKAKSEATRLIVLITKQTKRRPG